MKAKIKNGAVLQYPYTRSHLQAENPSTKFDDDKDLTVLFAETEQGLAGAQLVDVAVTEKPTFNQVSQYAQVKQPTLVNGVWTQSWLVLDHDAATAAQNLADLRLALEEEIKAIRDDRKINGGFPVMVDGVKHWFHSDTFSRTQWAILARKADKIEMQGGDMSAVFPKLDGSGPLIWKTMSAPGNAPVFVPVSPVVAQGVVDSGELMDTTTFYHAEVLIATIKQHPAPFMVDLHAGWPQIFGEPDPT